MSNDLIGIIDDQGRLNKEVEIKKYCPTLRAEAHGNNPKVVTPVLMLEYESKRIRKQYENGELDISRNEFLEKEIRNNDVSNTANTVRNDNLLTVVGVKEEIDLSKEEHPGIYVQLSDDVTVYAIWYPKYECYIAIRKLTPKECFRLQGWTDDYFEKAQLVNSDSQLYKQAGNGVTVNVVYEIAKRIPV